jgi:quercetin dioxygenase-like cupin family protein
MTGRTAAPIPDQNRQAAVAAAARSERAPLKENELPNGPGKSIKGVLVEYGPGGHSPGHTPSKSAFICASVLEGAIRSQLNDGPGTVYEAGTKLL